MSRSDERRRAVFAEYQHQLTSRPVEQLIAAEPVFTQELADGVELHRSELDEDIERHARGWSLDRIAPLERAIMLVALFEMKHRDDIPVEVAIDEAIELSKEYCGADAPGFVNGILGAVANDLEVPRAHER